MCQFSFEAFVMLMPPLLSFLHNYNNRSQMKNANKQISDNREDIGDFFSHFLKSRHESGTQDTEAVFCFVLPIFLAPKKTILVFLYSHHLIGLPPVSCHLESPREINVVVAVAVAVAVDLPLR